MTRTNDFVVILLSAVILNASSAKANYHPEEGRWISRDPIGEKGGYNLYGTVNNDPEDKWDYLGQIYDDGAGPDILECPYRSISYGTLDMPDATLAQIRKESNDPRTIAMMQTVRLFKSWCCCKESNWYLSYDLSVLFQITLPLQDEATLVPTREAVHNHESCHGEDIEAHLKQFIATDNDVLLTQLPSKTEKECVDLGLDFLKELIIASQMALRQSQRDEDFGLKPKWLPGGRCYAAGRDREGAGAL